MSAQWAYVAAAYAAAGVIFAVMVGVVLLDYRNKRRALARFGERGLRE